MTKTRDWLDAEYARGLLTFTFDEFRKARAMRPDAARAALARAQRDHLVTSPARGFYVIVPSEYRTDGAPPWQWYLDAMFRALGAPYYAGLLTAAAQHGASAQSVQEVQVVTDRHVRHRRVGRQRLVFIGSSRIAKAPTDTLKTPAGSVRISTPEMTMLDLVAYPRRAGGWSNIVSLLPDLADSSSRRGWKDALGVEPPTTHVQRLGYLLDAVGASGVGILAEWLRGRRRFVITLVPGAEHDGPVDVRWSVVGDPGVQPD
jgi:predicted transcriptional regulator of viral defense system